MGPGRKMIPMGPAHHALFQGKTRRPLLLARHTLDPAAPLQKSSHVIVQVILDLRTSDSLPASKNASPLVPIPRRSPHPSHPGTRTGLLRFRPPIVPPKTLSFKRPTAFRVQEYITAGRPPLSVSSAIASPLFRLSRSLLCDPHSLIPTPPHPAPSRRLSAEW